MNIELEVKILTAKTPAEEVVELSFLSGPSDEENYRKIMRDFISNSLSDYPDLEKGIVYCLYSGSELLASARVKQDDYTFSAASIEYFAVKSEFRGKGLGKFFLQGLFEEIEKRWNKKFAILATRDERGFYEKSGMKVLGELPDGTQLPRFYMYKRFGTRL